MHPPYPEANSSLEYRESTFLSLSETGRLGTQTLHFEERLHCIPLVSNKGDIRMLDSLGVNAKTQIPALGEPITGSDVRAYG
jgi:hypothetical protein